MSGGVGDGLEDEIRAIVSEVAEIAESEITAEGALEDVGVDSLLAVEIAVHVEERYGVRFDEAELADVRTFGQLVQVARRRLASGPA